MDVSKIAERLMAEHKDGVRYAPFAAASGIVGVTDAYAVQREYVGRLMAAHATKPAGYKIGLTTKRMQAMCGIDSPVAGVILADRVHLSGARIPLSAYGHVGLEFEIAVRLGREPRRIGHSFGVEEIADAVDGIAPAVEIIDDRYADYSQLDALSLIADNGWNGGIVLGEFVKPWPDLAAAEAAVAIAGKVIDRGFGRDVLGHTFQSVAWLATHLSASGVALRPGEIIMTGSLVTTKFPDINTSYRYELSGVGSVTLSIQA